MRTKEWDEEMIKRKRDSIDHGDSALASVFWKFSERMSAQLVSIVVSIILARLLTPEDYGIVSVVMILITLCNALVTGGLGNALIQKKDSDELDFSSVFYVSLALAGILYFAVFFLAKPIAVYFQNTDLVWILRIMAIQIPLSAVESVQQANISRQMQFRKFFVATIFGTVVSAFVGIVMAYKGMGPWALVAQYTTNVIVNTTMMFIVGNWRPQWLFSFGRLRQLLSYGLKILGATVLDTGFNELRSIIISMWYSPADLAVYDNGRKYPNMIVTNINASINSVIFPVMSKKQGEAEQIKRLMRSSVRMSSYILSPMLLGFMAIAERFVSVVLTAKWLICVPFIYITCGMCLFYPIHTINIQALNAIGESGKTLKLEFAKKAINIGILVVSVFFGVVAIALGGMLVSLISTYINAIYSKKMFGYSLLSQMKDVAPTLYMAGGMAAIVMLIDHMVIANGWLLLGLDVLIGGGVYVGLSCLFKIDSFHILRQKCVYLLKHFFVAK